jgi:hypothetical protein
MASLESVIVKGNHASLVFGFDCAATERLSGGQICKSNKDDEHWQ